MPTLHKLKLLATHCAVAGGASPSRSPTNGPVLHHRRRKTLRMFLSRSLPDSRHRRSKSPEEKVRVKNKLKDLFLSSPPPLAENEEQSLVHESSGATSSGGVSAWRRVGRRSLRPMSAAVRRRLLGGGAWRPVLGPIPE